MSSLFERLAALKLRQPEWTYDILFPELVPDEYKSVDPLKVHRAIKKGV